MSGIGETISSHLARFFERKLIENTPGLDYLRAEPEGYHSTWDYKCKRCVLRHQKTGIRVGADPLDLVERVDRRQSSEATRIVYIYLSEASGSTSTFAEVQAIANHKPREAWKSLVEHGILQRVQGSEDAAGLAWFTGKITWRDPVAASRLSSNMADSGEPWQGAEFCIPIHAGVSNIRRSTCGNSQILEVREPVSQEDNPELHVEREHGVLLVEAAARRDPDGVRSCLAARADVNFKDRRGWTALHAACAVRPMWEVFDLLFEHPKINLIPRSLAGQVPVDIADKYGQSEVAAVLREQMRSHPEAKRLVT